MTSKLARKLIPAVAALLLVPFSALAQDGALSLSTSTSAEFGEHVATGADQAVYIYVEDGENVSNCVDSCTNNWHPVVVDAGAEVAAEGNVDASLIATFERADGTTQVSYAGHPLYTSRHDDPGETRGQQVGRGTFILVNVAGEGITEAVEQEAVELDPAVLEQLMADGGEVYRLNCAACHGAEGQGGAGPKIAENSFVGQLDSVVSQVLNGFPAHGMPPFRDVLDDAQISSLLTYLRASFGNDYGPVLEEEVTQRR